MDQIICTAPRRQPWNKGKLVGQKAPLKLKEIWAIRVRLQLEERLRELAMFNLAIDSKLRSCDLVKLRVRDVCHGDGGRLDSPSRSAVRGLPVSEPSSRLPSYIDSTICTGCPRLGSTDRIGCIGLRHSYDAADKSLTDIQTDQEPAGRPVAFGPFQAGEHRPVLGH